MIRCCWLVLLLGADLSARPSYVTDTALATKLDTQSEAVVSPNAFSIPPLPGKWGAAVLDAMVDGDTSRAKDLAGFLADTSQVDVAGAENVAASLRVSLVTGGAPFDRIQSASVGSVVEASRASRAALDLLVVALEAKGEAKALFVNVAVKGAINKWNALISEAVKRWQVLSQKRDGKAREELQAIEAFLASKHTEGIHDALAAFRAQ